MGVCWGESIVVTAGETWQLFPGQSPLKIFLCFSLSLIDDDNNGGYEKIRVARSGYKCYTPAWRLVAGIEVKAYGYTQYTASPSLQERGAEEKWSRYACPISTGAAILQCRQHVPDS